MKIEIKTETKGYKTSLIVDGIDLSNVASAFELKQDAGEMPKLLVEIPVTEMNIDIPDAYVIVNREAMEHEAECGTAHGSD